MNSILHNKYLAVLSLLLVGQAVLFYSASKGENTPLPLPLNSLPATIGDWKFEGDIPINDETREILRADDLMDRSYVSPHSHGELFIAYFASQRTGQSPHSPKNCLPGSGYQPVDSETGRIDVPVQGRSIRINKYVVSKGEQEAVVLYWYQSQGRVIADEFAAKFYLIADSIRKHRSDTALVKVVIPVPRGAREEAKQWAVEFVQAAFPVVDNWLPR